MTRLVYEPVQYLQGWILSFKEGEGAKKLHACLCLHR